MGNKKLLLILLILLVVILSGTTLYLYMHGKAAAKSGDGTVSQTEAKALAQKVGRLIILPDDEVPTVATVSDPDKLKDQSFFASAKAGDKVLIYTNAKIAVLYDPTLDKIVTVAPINTGTAQSAPPASQPAGTRNGQF